MGEPDLTDEEIDRICAGLTQNAAKVRYLESLGVTVERKPNGRPLVNRWHYERVRSAGVPADRSDKPKPSNSAGMPKWTVAA